MAVTDGSVCVRNPDSETARRIAVHWCARQGFKFIGLSPRIVLDVTELEADGVDTMGL